MKTKIFGLALILILLVPQSYAQKRKSADSGITIGVLAGANFQNFYGTNSTGDKIDYNLKVGFHAGINAIIPFAPDLFFQPGLLLSVKGAKQEILENENRTTSLSYIEIPLDLLFRPQLGDGHILLGVGPYVAYGVAGKETDATYGTLSVKFLNKADLGNDNYRYYKPFDSGINILFGYEMYNGIILQLNTQLGLLKANSFYLEDKASKKNIGFGLSAGYRF